MTPLAVVGSAIALNVAIMVGGLVWATRQVKRVEAERAADYRAMFALEPLPPPGEEVVLPTLAERMPAPAEHLVFDLQEGHRVDPSKVRQVQGLDFGWHPALVVDQDLNHPATWSREKVAAELERLYGSGARGA